MEFQAALERLTPLLKRFWLPLIFATLGLIFFVYGLIWLIGSKSSENEVVFEDSLEASQSQKSSQKIMVDIEGAVQRPGVYSLAIDARIQDALVASGGLSSSADREWISKNLNLAVKLTDGAKIYIPLQGDVPSGTSQGDALQTPLRQGFEGQVGSSIGTSSEQININSASQSQLEALPGIGPVTAGKIINGRPYSSIDELLSKKIVGKSVFEKIKEKISIY